MNRKARRAMEHELQIIMRYEDGQPISNSMDIIDGTIDSVSFPGTGTVVFLDGNPIGCIQHIKIEADIKKPTVNVEITFPPFSDSEDESERWCNFDREARPVIEILKKSPSILVKKSIRYLRNIGPIQYLREIGTNGFIHSIRRKISPNSQSYRKTKA